MIHYRTMAAIALAAVGGYAGGSTADLSGLGIAALAGFAAGVIALQAETAEQLTDRGEDVATDGGQARVEQRREESREELTVSRTEDLARRGARLWLQHNDKLSQQEVADALSDDEVSVSRTSIARAVHLERRGSA